MGIFSVPRNRLTNWIRQASSQSSGCPIAMSAAAHTRDVAMVIGAEHIDQALEAALALLQVIGDVRRQNRSVWPLARTSTRSSSSPNSAGAKPHRAVLALRDARAARSVAIARSTAPLSVSSRSEYQRSNCTPNSCRSLADVSQHPRERRARCTCRTASPPISARMRSMSASMCCSLSPAGASAGSPLEHRRRGAPQSRAALRVQLCGDVAHVIAAIAVGRETAIGSPQRSR